MPRYMLEVPHATDDCARELASLSNYNREIVAKFEWGCNDATHTGWALVEADDKTSARMLLPMLLRGKAKVVRVQSVRAEDITTLPEPASEDTPRSVLEPGSLRHVRDAV